MTRGTRLRLGACLSLTGEYAPFGIQAAQALSAWAELDGGAEVIVEDDESSPERLRTLLPGLAARCDLLLGPYSTRLTRAAAEAVAGLDALLWNHSGSGDDVEASCPGHMVSILTPASRYAAPLLAHLAGEPRPALLCLATGRGSFGRQVVAGAERAAAAMGLRTLHIAAGDPLPADLDQDWDLLCAGSFEEDVARVERARALERPPRHLAAVAAGVRRFGEAVRESAGVLGVAQWFPGSTAAPVDLGPGEEDLLRAHARRTGTLPDYPGVQAAAAAIVATHCARLAGSPAPEGLWRAAASVRGATLFGPFRIDPVTGAQTCHQTVLLRWTGEGLVPAH